MTRQRERDPLSSRKPHVHAEHLFAIEIEPPGESPAGEHLRQPMAVVLPHLVVGNRLEIEPQRRGLVGLDGLAGELPRDENGAVQAVAVGELEVQFTALFERRRGDADFLLGFANGGGQRGFPRLDFPARTVDLARA